MINIKDIAPMYKGMSSRQASMVKLEGHRRERELASLLGLDPDNDNCVIPGTDKADLRFTDGKTLSLKAGKRTQFQTLSPYSRKLRIVDVGDLLKACSLLFVDCYYLPPQEQDRLKCELQPLMRQLKDYLKHSENLKRFIRQIMFSFKNGSLVDFLALKERHASIYHIFAREDVERVFSNHTEVVNSKARTFDQMDDQKVIIRGKGSPTGRMVNIIDNEVSKQSEKRTSTSFGSFGTTECTLTLLRNYITRSEICADNGGQKAISYGLAISSLTL
jgi:hypothetical protein